MQEGGRASSTGIILVWYGSEDINYKNITYPSIKLFFMQETKKLKKYAFRKSPNKITDIIVIPINSSNLLQDISHQFYIAFFIKAR
jgi:hypothetical protein